MIVVILWSLLMNLLLSQDQLIINCLILLEVQNEMTIIIIIIISITKLQDIGLTYERTDWKHMNKKLPANVVSCRSLLLVSAINRMLITIVTKRTTNKVNCRIKDEKDEIKFKWSWESSWTLPAFFEL